ncbi:MAG: hypothetical protein O7G32_04650 [SAR324 cluster bacterium]|nr:hypothetical protein [SAR324 cluster bacterium]
MQGIAAIVSGVSFSINQVSANIKWNPVNFGAAPVTVPQAADFPSIQHPR